jgi:membrane-bound serine protease (ClpP class)
VVAFAFGAIMMFDSGVPGFGISITFVIVVSLIFAGLLAWTLSYLLKLRRRGAVYGQEAIIGELATALEGFSGDGRVWLEGEAWAAHSKSPIDKDQQVRVVALDGLTVHVEPTTTEPPAHTVD